VAVSTAGLAGLVVPLAFLVVPFVLAGFPGFSLRAADGGFEETRVERLGAATSDSASVALRFFGMSSVATRGSQCDAAPW